MYVTGRYTCNVLRVRGGAGARNNITRRDGEEVLIEVGVSIVIVSHCASARGRGREEKRACFELVIQSRRLLSARSRPRRLLNAPVFAADEYVIGLCAATTPLERSLTYTRRTVFKEASGFSRPGCARSTGNIISRRLVRTTCRYIKSLFIQYALLC